MQNDIAVKSIVFLLEPLDQLFPCYFDTYGHGFHALIYLEAPSDFRKICKNLRKKLLFVKMIRMAFFFPMT